MILRAYTREDSPIIAKWLRTETELYQWSADRYGFFPLLPYSIDDNYAPQMKTGRFIPLTGVDEDGKPVGHLIIRYPKENDDSSVRFGFVIVDPDIRGKGYGRELLLLAKEYVKQNAMNQPVSKNMANTSSPRPTATGDALTWNYIFKWSKRKTGSR